MGFRALWDLHIFPMNADIGTPAAIENLYLLAELLNNAVCIGFPLFEDEFDGTFQGDVLGIVFFLEGYKGFSQLDIRTVAADIGFD